ncbi:hypothetical protein [Paenibacillus illinoisensis]|uniref:hypothetical protein n=1 Tax=Paenibacillus illinoisensis TaxID=59845 RepID=UPI00301C9887
MTTISLREIFDCAYSSCNGNRNEKDNAASDSIRNEFIKQTPEAIDLLEEVNDSIVQYGKELKFEISSTNYVTYTAFTQEYKKDITIHLKSTIDTSKIKSIFIHELGEANYIARSMPSIHDDRDRSINIQGRIIELFSHPHALRIARIYNVENIELEMRSKIGSTYKTKDYIKEYHYAWHITLMIAWALISFPDLRYEKDIIIGYQEHRSHIDRIVSICISSDTMGEKKIVESAMLEIINILSALGLRDISMKTR